MIKTAFVNNLSVVEIKGSNKRVEYSWLQTCEQKKNDKANNIRALIPSDDQPFVCIMCYACVCMRFVTILPLFNCKPYAHLMKLKQNGHNGIINNQKKEEKKWAKCVKHVEI